jgi:hypothetical protein
MFETPENSGYLLVFPVASIPTGASLLPSGQD